MAAGFVKQSMGLNPLASRRDWTILSGIVTALLLAAWLLLAMSRFPAAARGALIGGLAGMLPSLLTMLPVRGTVAAVSTTAFLGRVAQYGFAPAGETAEGQVFNSTARRWMRWDSNRVLVRRAANGDMQVTVPLFFYRQLRQHHS